MYIKEKRKTCGVLNVVAAAARGEMRCGAKASVEGDQIESESLRH
jgi:hypothetical protein